MLGTYNYAQNYASIFYSGLLTLPRYYSKAPTKAYWKNTSTTNQITLVFQVLQNIQQQHAGLQYS